MEVVVFLFNYLVHASPSQNRSFLLNKVANQPGDLTTILVKQRSIEAAAQQ